MASRQGGGTLSLFWGMPQRSTVPRQSENIKPTASGIHRSRWMSLTETVSWGLGSGGGEG
jgi:hypothetical protein